MINKIPHKVLVGKLTGWKHNIKSNTQEIKTGIMWSIKRLATGWAVRDSNPTPLNSGPEAHLASSTMGNGALSREKSSHGVTTITHPNWGSDWTYSNTCTPVRWKRFTLASGNRVTGVHWAHLTHNRDQWRALVDMVTRSINYGIFLEWLTATVSPDTAAWNSLAACWLQCEHRNWQPTLQTLTQQRQNCTTV